MSAFGNLGNIPGIASFVPGSNPAVPQKPKPDTRTPGVHMVNFYPLDGNKDSDLTVLMGDGPAQLTGGDGGWQVEERWADAPVTWWLSPQPYRQTIPVLFDGNSQEQAIAKLIRMSRSPGDRKPPPIIMVSGQAIHRADLEWVIESLTPTDVVRRRASDGNRVRQGYTVNLLQYGQIDILGKQTARTRRRPTTKSWRVRAEDNLPQIAAIVYGDSRRWKEIAVSNNIRDPRSLKIGRVLKIPG